MNKPQPKRPRTSLPVKVKPPVTRKVPEPFRVLIAVHRPRYRSRSERAVNALGWEIRSLLNKEDPIGLINQKRPDILIISDDFGRNKSMGFLKAAQKWRPQGLKIIAVFEDAEEMKEAAELYDAAFAPPWRTAEMREIVADYYRAIRKREPRFNEKPDEEEQP
jgi:hypothetical protein